MNKALIVLKHEFLQTIKRTGFIILTLALPVLALLGIGIFHIVSGITRPPAEITRIGYVDEAGSFDQFNIQGNLTLVRYENTESATRALLDKEVSRYFVIPVDFLSSGNVNLFSLQKELAPPAATASAIQNFIASNLLSGKVPTSTITRVETPLNFSTTTLTSSGSVANEQGGYANFIIPGIFSFLLALSLIFTSAYVLQSLSEEKESRLMEIILSSISTRQLLAGKVLGLGAAGLIQVIVWVISLPLLLNLASSSIGGLISTIQVPLNFWILGVLYFILGYLLFAVFSAAVAAVTSTVREAQGIAGIYSIFAVAPFWFVSPLLFFPNNPVWVVFSIFPFTAPVLVMLRLGVSGVPLWQLIISIGTLAVCIAGGLLLAARLLRTYMLMYGKRPALGEIVRNLKNL